MEMEFLNIEKKEKTFSKTFFVILIGILQGFLAVCVSTGMFPGSFAWLQILLALAAVVFLDPYNALLSLIVAIPFYLALPNPKFDSLSGWRIAVIFVFFGWFVKGKIWKKPLLKSEFWKGIYKRLAVWDKYILFFAIIAVVSIFFEPFKIVGAKKFLFLANAYAIYFLMLVITENKEQVIGYIKAFCVSAIAIIALGYIQFIATFFSSTYHFWQYWATVISRSYYGSALSDSLVYSNSWFSFNTGAAPSLRMFSILPDSHAFALVGVMVLAPLFYLLQQTQNKTGRRLYWISIVLTVISIGLSGTRGAWAGLVVPAIFWLYMRYKNISKKELYIFSSAFIFFILFVVCSPFVQKIFSDFERGYNSGNFITRAESIYDLQESSNKGRILIWEHTLAYDVKHPVLGSGLGNFVITLNPGSKDYNYLANTNEKEFNLPGRYITAHDLYLDVLSETGIFGLLAFLLYFWQVCKSHWQEIKAKMNPWFVYEFFILIWIVGYSLFDGTLINDRVLLYFLIGLAISAIFLKNELNKA
jgi:O-antigen ligase